MVIINQLFVSIFLHNATVRFIICCTIYIYIRSQLCMKGHKIYNEITIFTISMHIARYHYRYLCCTYIVCLQLLLYILTHTTTTESHSASLLMIDLYYPKGMSSAVVLFPCFSFVYFHKHVCGYLHGWYLSVYFILFSAYSG